MAIRLVPKAEPQPAAREEFARQLAVAGTPADVLIANVERQMRLINLCAEGFSEEFRRTKDARRRYANILAIANEELRQELRALIDVVREE